MRLSISSWSIRHPIPVAVLFIALLIAGVFGYSVAAGQTLSRRVFPAGQGQYHPARRGGQRGRDADHR